MNYKVLPIDTKQSVYECVLASAKRFPHKIALRYFGRKFTYYHLLKRINQFAYALKQNGVGKDDIVTVCLPNIPDAVYLFYAINQIGAIANIVHPLFTYEQMDETLEIQKCKLLYTLDINYKLFKPLEDKGIQVITCSPAQEFTCLGKAVYKKQNKDKLIPQKVTSASYYKFPKYTEYDKRFDNDSIYLHSGGTSGDPKIIALSSRNLNAVVTNAPWITHIDTYVNKGILAVLPMFHGFGLCMGVHAFLCYGGFDVLMPKFSRKNAVKYIAKNQLHILLGVPVLYEALLSKNNFRGRKLKNLNVAFVGGDYVSPALMERFDIRMEKAGSVCRLREGYGLTETVNVCAVNTHFHNKAGTVGIMLPNVDGVVIDEQGNELPPNHDGEICIGGETIMNGYRFLKDPQANKKVFYINKEGKKFIRTGDFGSIDEDRFITYKTRIKRIVKVNGVPVFPSMIEDCATSFNFVYEVCAIGIEDAKHGHIIRLYVMLSKTYKGTQQDAEKRILDRIVSRLGIYSKPKEIIFLDKMPHTVVGKIDYKLLK
jgi:long-chain acyl-CoA synthetase